MAGRLLPERILMCHLGCVIYGIVGTNMALRGMERLHSSLRQDFRQQHGCRCMDDAEV